MAHKIIPRVPREGPDSRWYSDVEEAFRHYTITIDPTTVAANTTVEQTFPVVGINTKDLIVVNKPTTTAGLGIVGSRSSAKDQIAITFINATGSTINPPSEQYNILAIRG